MSEKIEVTILGQKYVVRSDQGETLLREVAQFVDARLNEISRASRASPMNVAVLGALNIASEYFFYRRQMEALLAQIETKAQSLEALASSTDEPEDAGNSSPLA